MSATIAIGSILRGVVLHNAEMLCLVVPLEKETVAQRIPCSGKVCRG